VCTVTVPAGGHQAFIALRSYDDITGEIKATRIAP
jgi:hypothetical protein